jgi:hypothetical protein
MISIWKFNIPINDAFTVDMPVGARLLDVQDQGGTPVLWAMVETAAQLTKRAFALRGTGHKADGLALADHVGTFQMSKGALVFHLFDLGEAKS